jgi:hypothetical protein
MMQNEEYRLEVYERVVEGKKYYVANVGSEAHGRPSFTLFVHESLVETHEGSSFVRFPSMAEVKETEDKSVYVLIPSDNKITHYIFVMCGYRGTSTITLLSPSDAKIYKFLVYRSEMGSAGISEGALITVEKYQSVKIKWERTGRTYGEPHKGITIYHIDGSKEEIERVDEQTLKTVDEILGR